MLTPSTRRMNRRTDLSAPASSRSTTAVTPGTGKPISRASAPGYYCAGSLADSDYIPSPTGTGNHGSPYGLPVAHSDAVSADPRDYGRDYGRIHDRQDYGHSIACWHREDLPAIRDPGTTGPIPGLNLGTTVPIRWVMPARPGDRSRLVTVPPPPGLAPPLL